MQNENYNIKERILRLPEVIKITGLKRSSIYRLIGEGRFPQSVSLGARAVGWLESEIENWILEKAEVRKSKALSDNKKSKLHNPLTLENLSV